MKSRSDLLFYYTEKLGLLAFDDLIRLFQQGVNIEQHLKNENLPEKNLLKLQFILLKHFLLTAAQIDGLLTRDQANYLVNKKIWELKNNNAPFSMVLLDRNLISPEYFKEKILKLDQDKLFFLQDLSKLSKTILILPEEHKKVVSQLTENSKLKIQKEKVEEDGTIFYKYEIDCECGNSMIFELEVDSKIRLKCNKCKKLVLDLYKKDTAGSKTLNEIAPDLVEEMDWENKKTFANYELIKSLGEGTSGKVYLAKDLNTGEHVALKVLQKIQKELQLQYFNREIEVLKKIDHPHIISIKGWGKYKDKPYLSMEYVEGGTVLDFLQKNQMMSCKQAIQITIFALNGLIYAEQKALVHRDIKPANILIGKKGQVKLIDLGLAKILEDSKGLTQSGQLMGTPYYIAPEQIGNFKKVDHRADIYSMGATLYHCLCGIPPFGEYQKSMMMILTKKIKDEYIRLEERNTNIPKILIQIVHKAMALNVQERYQTALEMKQDLVSCYKTQKL